MKCYLHSESEAVGLCVSCGKALCEKCQKLAYGKLFCQSCFEEGPFNWFDIRFGFKDFSRAVRDFMFLTSRCPKCGRSIRKEFRLCPYCGASLKVECSDCSQPLDPDWRVCPYCGSKKS